MTDFIFILGEVIDAQELAFGLLPYIALFLTAFAAATILPFSSEAAVIASILAGMDPWAVLLWASAGNCLACLLNYGMGWFFSGKMSEKLRSSKWGRKSLLWFHKYGMWSMLLSWAPLIGDPLTIVAGLFRLKLLPFLAIVWFLRIARYVIIIGLM
ncbi:MAG: VTT domain-containing protein [Balneolales bacterium]|nr:VTT domain-containing protein [Balneolales bacterium]